MTWLEILDPVIMTLIEVAVMVLALYAARWLREKGLLEHAQRAAEIATAVVRAVEQQYPGLPGQAKKEIAEQIFRRRFGLDPAKMEPYLEKAVQELHEHFAWLRKQGIAADSAAD